MNSTLVTEYLPEPVRRYFKSVLPDTRGIIQSVRMKQKGTFLTPGSSRWQPFEAEEVFTTHPRSMMWDARIHMGGLLTARVRDQYQSGRGSTRVSLFRFFTMVNEHDHPELDAAALQRFLAECIWFPTALFPAEGVVWTGIDESRALARLTDRWTTVSLEFTFAPNGEISSIFTPVRYRAENGRFEPAPWGATCGRYETHAGVRIPAYSEVYWELNGRICPYWRGEIVSVQYNFGEN